MEEVRNSVTPDTFRGMLRYLSKYELLLFFVIIPVLMIGIYFLPSQIKDTYFILYSSNPGVPNLFLSNYTHSAPLHIISNLTVYFVVMFLVFNLETNKRAFRTVMFLTFLVLPWLLSLSLLSLLTNLPPSQGVSGVVAALLGYLTFSAYRYVKRTFRIPVTSMFPFFIFAVNMLVVVATLLGISVIFYILVGFIILTGLLSARAMIAIASELKRGLKSISTLNVSKNRRQFVFEYRFAVAFLTALFVFTVFLLIPRNPVEGSTLTNSLAHYIGYIFGLFVPLIGETILEIFGSVPKSPR